MIYSTFSKPLRFISAEPLLGPLIFPSLEDIGWVIVGGESGPNARYFNDDWARSIRDQCAEAGVPFFFKQRGGKHGHELPELDGVVHTDIPKSLGSTI
jgi:protein gp37